MCANYSIIFFISLKASSDKCHGYTYVTLKVIDGEVFWSFDYLEGHGGKKEYKEGSVFFWETYEHPNLVKYYSSWNFKYIPTSGYKSVSVHIHKCFL